MSIQLYEVPLKGKNFEGKRVVVAHTLVEGEQQQVLPLIDEVSSHVPPKNGYARFTPAGFALRAISADTAERLDEVVADATVHIEVIKAKEPVDPTELLRYVGEEVLTAAFTALPKMPKPQAEQAAELSAY